MEVEPDPAPAPGRFKSLVQLRTWASRRFPRATLVTEGLDLKAWNRIAPILDSLASEWPGVAGALGWITTRHPLWEDNPRGAIAAADSLFGEKLAFNPFYFASPRMVAEAAKEGERFGTYPRGAGQVKEWYFVTHEWGHLVYAWLRRHHRERWHELAILLAADPGNPRSDIDLDKAAAISQYSKSSLAEAFAEIFSVIQWRKEDDWPEIVRQFSRILGGEP